MAKFRRQIFNDLGLGSKATEGNYRALNKNGSFNVKRVNLPFYERINFFHSLVTMSWPRFFLLVAFFYFSINIIFASLYMLVGLEHLTGMDGVTEFEKFMEAFFFSAQTITTLGYGRVAPLGMLANSVAAVESLLGLLSFALATGMLYGRFSKPSAKIKYSECAVIAPYQDINAFMFRIVNPQDNQLLEVDAHVTLSMKRDGSSLRDFFQLELERSNVVFLPSVWTIVHPISDQSPLYGLTESDFHEKDVEFIIMMKAFDESFSQTVYSRSSYKNIEIKWGQKFMYILDQHHGKMEVDIGRLSETEMAALNP